MQDYRLSPQGVLAKRDVVRYPGWMQPHWKVIDVPAGDTWHYPGQLLVDQAVAGWDVLRRLVVDARVSTRHQGTATAERLLAEAHGTLVELDTSAARVVDQLLAEPERQVRHA
jgi:hypothetical protein